MGRALKVFEVSDASSRARRRPRIETRRALSLSRGGIVIIGVLEGRRLRVINKPAIMLPQARRFNGLIISGLFSLIGDDVLKRGKPMETKKTTRRL